jgi:hypothetical protein
MELNPQEICRKAGIPLLLSPSIKAGLDINWSDPRQKATAVQIVERQVTSLVTWVEKHLDDGIDAPLKKYLEAVATVRDQDVERTKKEGVRVRQGVAVDRRIPIEDPEMRHGRKSRSKRFDGYKEHIAFDLDAHAILACAVTPANRPEEEGAAPLAEDIDRQALTLDELHIDRACVNSPVAASVVSNGGKVLEAVGHSRAQARHVLQGRLPHRPPREDHHMPSQRGGTVRARRHSELRPGGVRCVQPPGPVHASSDGQGPQRVHRQG